MEDLIHIGYTNKAHGLNGEIKLKIKDAFTDDFFELEVIFLKKGGSNVPYFIESVREGNALIVKFEDIERREHAERLESKELFARKSDLNLIEGGVPELKHLSYGHLIDFLIIDDTMGELGKIKQILDYPQQEMAIFDFKSREKMIPLNKHFIKQVDVDNQTIHVSLPEGLFDL